MIIDNSLACELDFRHNGKITSKEGGIIEDFETEAIKNISEEPGLIP